MSLVEINWSPSCKDLRVFSIVSFVAAILLAVLLHSFKHIGMQWAVAIFLLGAAVLASCFVCPKLTRVIYLGFVFVTLPIGLAMSILFLSIFYFGILTPLGFIFRLIGRDTLHRKYDPDTESYWITHRQPDNLDRYYNQF